jgi:hypothetical protein
MSRETVMRPRPGVAPGHAALAAMAVNQTYGFFTRGSFIGGESISLRASAVVNRMAVSFSLRQTLRSIVLALPRQA